MENAPIEVYVDAGVLFVASASSQEYSASQVILTLSEITVLEAVTSELAVEECRRNLRSKLPEALSFFESLVEVSTKVVASPSLEEVKPFEGCADAKDQPHLASSVLNGCSFLVIYNVKDYQPGDPRVEVLSPGALLRRIRRRLRAM